MLILLALIVALQQPPQPGTIEGAVVRTGTTAPIAGVHIRAIPASSTPVETTTDGAGRFVFRNLPAGRVVLEARADGYMFSTKIPQNSVLITPVEGVAVADDYVIPNAVLRLPVNVVPGETLKVPAIPAAAAAVIRGRVVDNDGHGLPDVPVAFIGEITDGAGHRLLVTEVAAAKTDAQGQYRQEMLFPGTYSVKATIGRPDGAPLILYYPATTDVRAAATLVLTENAEVTADIEVPTAVVANTFTISGRLSRLPEKPASSVTLLLRTLDRPSASVADTSLDQQTGRFDLRGIRPGSYELFAIANIGDTEYLGKVPIEIRSRNIEDVEIPLDPGAGVSGRLVVPRDRQNLQLVRAGAGTISIALRRKDGLFRLALRPTIDETGTAFTFPGVPVGAYDIDVNFVADRGGGTSSSDLYVADVRTSGGSVFDRGLEVGVDPTNELEVVIGTDSGTITGAIVSAPSKQTAVVVLAPDAARRSNTSLFKTVAGDADGQFLFRGLAPGTYKIFAVPSGTPLLRRDVAGGPEAFMSPYEARAITVVVRPGISVGGIQVPVLSSGR